MSRRQALGVISNNYSSASNANQTNTNHQTLKATNTFKPFSKNENEPPPWTTKPKQQTEFDFEIFQEDLQENKKQSSAALQPLSSNSALHKFASKHGYHPELQKQKNSSTSLKENELSAKRSDKENLLVSKEPVVFSNDLDEDEEEEEPVTERYAKEDNEFEEDDDDDDDDAYTSEDEDDEEDEYTEKNDEVEEEGISRLNLAALVDSSNESCKKITKEIINTSSELMTMDSSSSTQHDLSSSPMMLDDTIKFHSHLSQFEEDEECDEEKEERLKKQAVAERERLLVDCLEYKDEILSYMRQMELENRPKASYMRKQQDINSSMRSILVDWLVEVSEEYKLNTETLYLAVNYTDRFLSQMSVLRGKLQLVGTASMYIASKYEEISPPDVSEFVYITDDTYTKKQVLRMEHLLLKVLDFRMNTPTINCFLMHYLRFLKVNSTSSNTTNSSPLTAQQQEQQSRIENLARYLAELTLIDSETFLRYLPSQIAASAIYLSLHKFNKPWTKQIAEQLGYSFDLSELKLCIADMYKCMQQAEHHPQQAIQEKYKQAKYDYVSLIEPARALPQFFSQ